MGYFKNLEIANQIEEPDRVLTRRQLKAHRRETYRAPKHFVISNGDFLLMLLVVPVAISFGFVLALVFVR